MPETNTPISIEILQRDLIKVMQDVTDFIKESDDVIFQKRINDKWSIAENLEHLILSNGGISKLLSMPKTKITQLFGSPTHTSRLWSELELSYLDGIKKGAKAPPPFMPKDTTEKSKAALLEDWKGLDNWLEKGFQQWSEEALDLFQVPHVILGNMTIRELLEFSIFHTYHHLKAMKKISEKH